MTLTLSQIRILVRRALKDEDSNNYRWTDDQIDLAIQQALAEVSKYCPVETTTDIATTDGSREIDISALSPRVRVEKVEFPIGQHPKSYQRFAIYANTLTLIGDLEGNGEDARIYWLAPHTLNDQTSTLTPDLESLVMIGATAYAVLSLSQYVTETAGIGGPNADRDLREWGTATMNTFKKELRSHARYNKVRTGELYVQNH